MKIITAKFTGKDAKLKTGDVYKLTIIPESNLVSVIITTSYRYTIPYESIAAFLKNWDEIKKEK